MLLDLSCIGFLIQSFWNFLRPPYLCRLRLLIKGTTAGTNIMKKIENSHVQDAKDDSPFASKKLSYLNKPPSIPPNYGRKHYNVCYILKSNISRVLLYDNMTQQRMLDRKLNLLGIEQRRVMQLFDHHRKSFVNQRILKLKRFAFQSRLPAIKDEENKKVKPGVIITEGAQQQQRLPEIASTSPSSTVNDSNSSSVLNRLVSTSGGSGL